MNRIVTEKLHTIKLAIQIRIVDLEREEEKNRNKKKDTKY